MVTTQGDQSSQVVLIHVQHQEQLKYLHKNHQLSYLHPLREENYDEV